MDWEELKTALQKEIHLLREILASMYQEETALLVDDKKNLEVVLQMRPQMYALLYTTRSARMNIILRIEKEMQKKLDELLQLFQTETCEIVSLHEQLILLMEKLNDQNHKNQLLTDHGGTHRDFPFFHYPIPEKKKKKSSIATYPHETLD